MILSSVLTAKITEKLSTLVKPLLIIGGVLLTCTILYFYIGGLKADINTLIETKAKLTLAIDTQNKVIESYKEDFEQAKTLNKKLQTISDKQTEQIANLTETFNDHNLGELALKKTKLIENIINKGTTKVNRCFELITGSELEKGETIETIQKCKENL